MLSNRLTPKSSRDEVTGIQAQGDGPRLAVRVRALANQGAANTALLVVLAKWLGLPRNRLELIAGGKSRAKQVAIAGDGAELERLLSDLLKPQ